MEQVLYRCPNRANPCFSHSLCLEELNDLVQLPIASHKTEQPVVAEESPSTMVGWGCEEKDNRPDHSILSVEVG